MHVDSVVSKRFRPFVVLFAVLALCLSLGACSANDSLAKQANAGVSKNFIAGDGSVTVFAPAKRKAPVSFTGTLYDGKQVSSAQFKNKVTVLNFWYAECAPCRKEAKNLEATYKKFKADGVNFYGVNNRDDKAGVDAFNSTFGMTYPSINDQNGNVLLAMAANVPAGAVPTTIVLDKQGRVAARVLGTIDPTTLKGLISDSLAGK